MSLIPLIICLSVVQSLFGVGILVFGTPILLLFGYSFETTLLYLLPSSIVVSTLQVINGRKETRDMGNKYFLYLVPPLVLGLLLVLVSTKSYDVKFAVGLLLVINGFLRLSQKLQTQLKIFFAKFLPFSLALTGFVHGISNMGGGLLTILISSLFRTKEEIRANVAYGYLIMAFSQLMILLFFHVDKFLPEMLILPLFAGTTFVFLGNRLFNVSSQMIYQHLMTLLIFLFGFGLVIF